MWTLSAWCPFLLCSDVWQHWAWFVGHWVAVDDSPKFTSHVTSCGPPSFVFIQMYLFWLLFILVSLDGWSFSGVWVFATSSAITAGSGFFHSYSWLICQCYKLLVPDFSWCKVIGADFITPAPLSLLPFSRLVILLSIPLHDGCINCRLYNMYLLFLCSDLCPFFRITVNWF